MIITVASNGGWHLRFLKAVATYNADLLLVFFGVYSSMDFAHHFSSTAPVTSGGKLYFTIMTHAAVGSNDISPRTDLARGVMALHVTLAWSQILFVFLAR